MLNTRGGPFPDSKRPVTSCSECYRRKQKCNRERPCDNCLVRGVADTCQYQDSQLVSLRHLPECDQIVLCCCSHVFPCSQSRSANAVRLHRHRHNLKPNAIVKRQELTPSSTSPGILDQIGYSAASRRKELQNAGIINLSESSQVLHPTQDAKNTSVVDEYSELLTQLPSEDAVNQLLKFYFSYDNWSYPVLDEHYMYNLYESWRVQNKLDPSQVSLELFTFPPLLFSVLAVALQFLPFQTKLAYDLNLHSFAECDKLSQQLHRIGYQIYERLRTEQVTLTAIEYNLSRTMWLKNCGRGKECWQSLSMAVRQAQEIDLHQVDEGAVQNGETSVQDTLLRLWDVEHRKRLWARLFILDSHMAMALGRPRAINRQDCTTSEPLDCDYPKEPYRIVPISVKHDREPPCNFSPTLFWIAISHKIHDMLSLRAEKRDFKEHDRIGSLGDEASSLLYELPPALRPQFPDKTWDLQLPHLPPLRLRIATIVNIFLLALHRPYISIHDTSRDAATEAAFQILFLQKQLFSLLSEPQYKLYGHSFYTVDSAIFLASMAMKDPIPDFGLLGRINIELQSALERLALMKERNPVAAVGEVILQRCCRVIKAKLNVPFNVDRQRWTDVAITSQDLDLETAAFLREFDTRTPYEPAHQLVSMLSNSTQPYAWQAMNSNFPNSQFTQEDGYGVFLLPNEGQTNFTNFAPNELGLWPQ